AGVIRESKTGLFVALEGSPSTKSTVENETLSNDSNPSKDESAATNGLSEELAPQHGGAPTPGGSMKPKVERPKQLFVAHGKNHKPLEDLKKMLGEFKIPYKVAVDEANKGRPISAKVAELMNECSAGIFIFTKDERFFRELKDGTHEEVWRPSENV